MINLLIALMAMALFISFYFIGMLAMRFVVAFFDEGVEQSIKYSNKPFWWLCLFYIFWPVSMISLVVIYGD